MKCDGTRFWSERIMFQLRIPPASMELMIVKEQNSEMMWIDHRHLVGTFNDPIMIGRNKNSTTGEPLSYVGTREIRMKGDGGR